jgi:hypothetical protein
LFAEARTFNCLTVVSTFPALSIIAPRPIAREYAPVVRHCVLTILQTTPTAKLEVLCCISRSMNLRPFGLETVERLALTLKPVAVLVALLPWPVSILAERVACTILMANENLATHK